MIHNFINFDKLDKDLDKNISKIFRINNSISFIANEKDLKQINKDLFPENEHDFFAWKYRTIPVKAWNIEFTKAYLIDEEVKKIFSVKRKTFWEILWFAVEMISIVHPFLDWNRRTIWKYTNEWLKWEWYEIINWKKLRPFWEVNKYSENTFFLNKFLLYIKEQKKL